MGPELIFCTRMLHAEAHVSTEHQQTTTAGRKTRVEVPRQAPTVCHRVPRQVPTENAGIQLAPQRACLAEAHVPIMETQTVTVGWFVRSLVEETPTRQTLATLRTTHAHHVHRQPTEESTISG